MIMESDIDGWKWSALAAVFVADAFSWTNRNESDLIAVVTRKRKKKTRFQEEDPNKQENVL